MNETELREALKEQLELEAQLDSLCDRLIDHLAALVDREENPRTIYLEHEGKLYCLGPAKVRELMDSVRRSHGREQWMFRRVEGKLL